MKASSSDSDLFSDLEELLQIDEHALEEALLAQPDAFYQVSKRLALEESRRDALKQYVKDAEAAAYLDYKKRGKATAEELKALVRTDKDVQDVVDKLLEKERMVGRLNALLDAFKQRGYALRDLWDLHMQSYYSDSFNTERHKRHMAIREKQQTMRDSDYRRRGIR